VLSREEIDRVVGEILPESSFSVLPPKRISSVALALNPII